jgi:dipeptidyl aminopeptidase/acylaminoacyl peptidase
MMDRALTAACVKHELVTFSGLDHRLVDSAASMEVLRRSDEFLRVALGPGVPRAHWTAKV